MVEIWVNIIGYEGLYQVSNLGRIKSLNYNNTKKENILKPINSKGYLTVHLSKNNKKQKLKIHRLVASHFLKNYNKFSCINHKDENKKNNNVENLEWCSTKYNNNYGTRNERIGKSNKGKKRTFEMNIKQSRQRKGCFTKSNNNNSKSVICTTTGEIFSCMKDGVEKYGINTTGITDCCKGRQKSAGKLPNGTPLKWMYYNEYKS